MYFLNYKFIFFGWIINIFRLWRAYSKYTKVFIRFYFLMDNSPHPIFICLPVKSVEKTDLYTDVRIWQSNDCIHNNQKTREKCTVGKYQSVLIEIIESVYSDTLWVKKPLSHPVSINFIWAVSTKNVVSSYLFPVLASCQKEDHRIVTSQIKQIVKV